MTQTRTEFLAPISAFILFSVLAIPAAFSAPSQYSLTVIVQGDGIVSDPAGFTCSDDCEQFYKKNSTVTLTATANPNSSFLRWNDDCAGNQLTCELKMDAPKNVTALFDTAVVTPVAPVPQTGQTTCYDVDGNGIPCGGTGQDGEYQVGVPSPNPRFIDNLNGTVTDNQTGIVWLKDAKCTFLNDPDGEPPTVTDWQTALDQIALLGDGICGLSDGSGPGDWLMPNVNQLASLFNWGNIQGIPFDHPFDNFGGARYWYSTSNVANGVGAWWVQYGAGIGRTEKIFTAGTWAVRSPD